MSENDEIKRAREKAMDLLLFKDRTEKELENRLVKAGFSETSTNAAMEYVESFGYINDLRYAKNFISFRQETKSRKEIRYKLIEKGVDKETIELAFEDDYAGESMALRNLLKKRLKGTEISELSKEEKQKHIAYLARKGFSLHDILKEFDSDY